VVIGPSLCIAQGIAKALDIEDALVVQFPPAEHYPTPARPPKLTLVLDGDFSAAAEAIDLARYTWPGIAVLVAGVPNREDLILAYVSAHVDGIVLADEPFEELRSALFQVTSGAFRPPPSRTLRPVLDRLVWLSGAPHGGAQGTVCRLSTREVQVLERLARGETNKEAAIALQIEVQTVKNHVTNIFRKLHVATRAGAVRVGLPVQGDRPPHEGTA